jgi:hypothetical protein
MQWIAENPWFPCLGLNGMGVHAHVRANRARSRPRDIEGKQTMSEKTAVQSAPRPSLAMGGGMLVAIFALSSLWVFVGGHFLHLHSFFASFVFLWYWGVVEKAEFNRLPASILGALTGVALSWQLSYLSAHYATAGLAAGVAVIAVAVFIQLMNWVPIAVNLCAMLFLAILTAPQFMGGVNYADVAATTLVGAVYGAAVIYAARRVVAGRGPAKAPLRAA